MMRMAWRVQAGACALGLAAFVSVLALSAEAVRAQSTDVPKKPAASNAESGDTSGGELDAGQLAFNTHCRTCHSMAAGDNRLGPSLAGIVGSKAGRAEGFAYSQSLKNSGITFDEATLDAFIANPEGVVPGTNMKPYPGIPDAKVRTDIIGYLKRQ